LTGAAGRCRRKIAGVTPREIASLLKAWALEAGFDRAGVAQLDRAAHGGAFVRWLDAGHQAGMDYLERRVEHRLEPERLVPGARSILCVALRYLVPEDESLDGDLWPRVARYARGDDYHDLMGRRLEELRARIDQAFPGAVMRSYVDTGPVLEREWAARAALGAIGKNTNLLHPTDGSYLLLGEMFLSLDLEPDVPLADLCGSCRACLDACPTGALAAPYLLDSRLCISYWTIEHRGVIPTEVRPLLEDWVFGCDVCQEVCPWNAQPQQASEPALALPAARRRLSLVDLVGLGRADYEARFRGSPMKRAKRSGLRRNAAVAMGNRRRSGYVPALALALGDGEDPDLRRHAAWALGRIGGEPAVSALRNARSSEDDAEVLAEIDDALERADSVDTPGTAHLY
jgi:epoxyqueuosine reductase